MKKSLRKNLMKRGKDECDCGCSHWNHKSGCGGIYFLGFVGSAIFYIQQATGFWNGVVAILKAMVWPAFLVYKLLSGL